VIDWNNEKIHIKDLIKKQSVKKNLKHKKVEKVEEANPTTVPGKPEMLKWNNKEFHIRDLMHDHVSGFMKEQVSYK
jgi:hypothetical protein